MSIFFGFALYTISCYAIYLVLYTVVVHVWRRKRETYEQRYQRQRIAAERMGMLSNLLGSALAWLTVAATAVLAAAACLALAALVVWALFYAAAAGIRMGGSW